MYLFDGFVATEKHVKAPWNGNKKNFRCAWCGHRFEVGDHVRAVYTNTSAPENRYIQGNPLICSDCDGPDEEEVKARLRETAEAFRGERSWWHLRQYTKEEPDE